MGERGGKAGKGEGGGKGDRENLTTGLPSTGYSTSLVYCQMLFFFKMGARGWVGISHFVAQLVSNSRAPVIPHAQLSE